MAHRLSRHHEPHHLLGSLDPSTEHHHFDAGLPLYQPSAIHGRQTFDFEAMEDFASEKKKRLGLLNSPSDERPQTLRTRKASQASPSSGEVWSCATVCRRHARYESGNLARARHYLDVMAAGRWPCSKVFQVPHHPHYLPVSPPRSPSSRHMSIFRSQRLQLATTDHTGFILFERIDRSHTESERTPWRRPIVRRYVFRNRRAGYSVPGSTLFLCKPTRRTAPDQFYWAAMTSPFVVRSG